MLQYVVYVLIVMLSEKRCIKNSKIETKNVFKKENNSPNKIIFSKIIFGNLCSEHVHHWK